MTKFFIKNFADYHKIRSSTHKYIELGCFPSKEGWGYNRYFGLFFKGRKPALNKVLKSLKRKVDFDTEIKHYRTGLDIGITEQELENEVKESLAGEPNGPDIYL